MLSETAIEDLNEIYAYSLENWGEDRAVKYIQAFYLVFQKLVRSPAGVPFRNRRSSPFRLVPMEEHFVLYDLVEERVVILTLFHQSQNVEKRVASLTPVFMKLVQAMVKDS